MKKLWFFATFLSIFALFSDISFARRGSAPPTPKVLTPSKVNPTNKRILRRARYPHSKRT